VSHTTYLLLHLTGVILLFTSLGGVLVHAANQGTKETNSMRKFLAAAHGSSLLLLLIAGFGLLAKLGMTGMPPLWAIVKLVIWLFMGAALAIGNKSSDKAKPTLMLVIVLGIVAAWLGVTKPM